MSKRSVSIQKWVQEITEVELFQALQRLMFIGSEYEEELGAWKESVLEVTPVARRCLMKVSKITNVEDPLFQEISYMVHELVDMADMLENNLISVRYSIFKWLLFRVIPEWYSSSLNSMPKAVKDIDLKMSQLLMIDGSSDIDDDDDEYEKDEEKSGRSGMCYLRAKRNNEDDVVGFEGYTSQLSQIVVGMKEDKQQQGEKEKGGGGSVLAVVGIVGIGGVGKTTLARKVYNMSLIREEFDCRIWINALPSRHQFRRGDVMVDILQQSLGSRVLLDSSRSSSVVEAGFDADDYYYKQVSNTVRICLKDRRVFLVLDDIDEICVWETVKDVLPNGNGSIVIFTTRYASLPSKIPECSHVLSVGPLSMEESWSLFCRNAMHDPHTPPQQEEEQLTDALKVIGQSIVERCGGLPLAIVLIARLLATKKPEPSIWAKVFKRMELHLSSSPPASLIDGLLSLSYEDLPCSLRSCFTYCSLFCKALQELPAKKLCRLWLAEGFIISKHLPIGKKIVTAEDMLDELIRRNLIQVGRVGPNGEVETCRLLRHMRSFCNILLEVAPPRRIICSWLGGEDDDDHHHQPSIKKLRALQFVGLNNTALSCYEKKIPHLSISSFPELWKFNLLRVLDFHYVPLKEVPDKMGHLVNLQYLGFRGTGIMKFSSLKALPKLLQTLDIRDTMVTKLPNCISHLTRLEHLYLSSSHVDKVIPLPIEMETTKSLSNLRKLAGVKITEGLVQALGGLTRLEKFSGGQLKEEISASLCTSLNKLESLKSLAVKCDYVERFNLDALGNCDKLSKLRIGGQLLHLDRVALINSLTSIHLWDSMLDEDPLSTLQHLPNLVDLSLCNAYRGRLIACDSQGFPKLKKLSIVRFSYLEEWGKLEGAALHSLEELKVGRCPKLHKLPEGIACLDSLQLIQVLEVPLEPEETQKVKFRRIPNFI